MIAGITWFVAWEWINIAIEYTSVAWVRLPRFFLAVVAVNLLTHPIFVLTIEWLGRTWPVTLACEAIIFLVEAVVLTIFYGFSEKWRMTLAAFVMNMVSFSTGILLRLSY